MRKTTSLRRQLNDSNLTQMVGVYDGLSGRVVEEAGFAALWGSGLCITASLGLTDNSVASFTEIVSVARQIAEVTAAPLLLDGDAGYGGVLQARRFAKRVEDAGVAGLCLEDNVHPKRNSLLTSGSRGRPLVSISEFVAKLRAVREVLVDPDFVLVARTEAFIAGRGLDEALRRAHHYVDAGADAILVHSAKSDATEVLEFCRHWKGRTPLVAVPTRYDSTPMDTLHHAGVSMVIWANHAMRAAVQAMQRLTRDLRERSGAAGLDSQMVGVDELFRLQRQPDLDLLERRYLSVGVELEDL